MTDGQDQVAESAPEVGSENPTNAAAESTQDTTSSAASGDAPAAGEPSSDTSNQPSASPDPFHTAKNIFADEKFHDFVSQHVFDFLDIMDIQDSGDRRDTIISIAPHEEEIRQLLAIADAYLCLQMKLAAYFDAKDLVGYSHAYRAKHDAMRKWLTI